MLRPVQLRRRPSWGARYATVLIAVAALVGGFAVPATAAQPPVTQVAAQATTGVGDAGLRVTSLAGFTPGNIISDAVFFNAGTMGEAQIQSFLNGKVPTCQAGYVCLKDFRQSTYSRPASPTCAGAYAGEANESAARIVYKVAQACGINPQVLLTTLQKEQGLVTHTWPSEWRYTIAMGQGCPDTAACDTKYYGFYNQVYGAASQFKRYANPPGTSNYFTWYAPGKTWNVRYHPNVACGSSPVFIQNQATANLYYYTPYQPNAAALAAGYAAANDACSSYGNRNFYNYFTDWFGSTQVASIVSDQPRGALEVVQSLPGQFRVAGWAIDPNTADPIEVHVYVGGAGYATTANISRPDVGAAFPAAGANHGYDVSVPVPGPGAFNVCVYAINAGPGANALIGCANRTAMSGSPLGVLESVRGIVGGVVTSGWAIDPDTAAPIPVHVYVDAAGIGVTADLNRPDVGAAFPGYGGTHGFNATSTASPGIHRVCAYAINVGPGGTTTLGCSMVTVPAATDLGRSPIGNYETLTVSGTTATAGGWAIDPDTSAPIQVQVTVNGAVSTYTADGSRLDVGTHYPQYGPNHGFSAQVQLPVGTSEVCVTAINNTAVGGNGALGCRTATVAAPPPPVVSNHQPIGLLDGVVPSAGGVTVTGWAIDPDTANPIAVHIYVDSTGYAYLADKSRPDVAAVYTAYGDLHGYNQFVPASSGSHRVCVYAIDASGGNNPTQGCRTVVVP